MEVHPTALTSLDNTSMTEKSETNDEQMNGDNVNGVTEKEHRKDIPDCLQPSPGSDSEADDFFDPGAISNKSPDVKAAVVSNVDDSHHSTSDHSDADSGSESETETESECSSEDSFQPGVVGNLHDASCHSRFSMVSNLTDSMHSRLPDSMHSRSSRYDPFSGFEAPSSRQSRFNPIMNLPDSLHSRSRSARYNAHSNLNNSRHSRRSMSSVASRENLQMQMDHRKNSLTAKEQTFLHTLMEKGGDDELDAASVALLDDSLFFAPCDDVEQGDGLEVVLRDSTARPSRPMPKICETKPAAVVVSERKKQLLETRKNTDVYEQMWKAHEKGLSVSPFPPRKSVGEIVPDSKDNDDLMSSASSLHSLNSHNTEFFRTSADGIFRCTALPPDIGAEISVSQKRVSFQDERGIVSSEGFELTEIPSIARATELMGSYSQDVSEPIALQASQDNFDAISSVEVARLCRVSKSMDDSSVCTGASPDLIDSKYSKAQLKRNLSDDDISSVLRDSGLEKSLDKISEEGSFPPTNSKIDDDKTKTRDLNDSDRKEDEEEQIDQFNVWDVLKSDSAEGYGGVNYHPFLILGTSANDTSAQPHVLSPPLMESLQYFFPYVASEDNFWMKFSLLRDGASLYSMMQMIRGAKYTILALETVHGEVFGSFTGSPWRKQHRFFGSGEAFLWRMRRTRDTPCHSIIDQAKLESELEVYPWTGNNYLIQLYQQDRIAVGSEIIDSAESDDPGMSGFGLTIDKDLLTGSSSPCITFGNPCLCKHSQDGIFEIANMEVWTLTPFRTEKDAEKSELRKLFLEV